MRAAPAFVLLLSAALARAGDGSTAARPTAESGFEALRRACADRDDAVLRRTLRADLVKDWPDLAAGEAKAWRDDLAARIAEGDVVHVKETGDRALARWRTASAVREIRLRLTDGAWVADDPWAWCVGGTDLARVNGRSAPRVKLKARRAEDAYGGSAFSFAHVTKDPRQCANRMDVWYCSAGHLHGVRAMLSELGTADLAKVEGLQTGGDRSDQVTPKPSAVYLVDCRRPGRGAYQVALQVTSRSDDALEFAWRVVAAGPGAPADVRTPQPLVTGDGADGCDGFCGRAR